MKDNATERTDRRPPVTARPVTGQELKVDWKVYDANAEKAGEAAVDEGVAGDEQAAGAPKDEL